MFGDASMAEMLKQSYVEQVESMATLLRLIEQEGLHDQLAEIVGKPLLELLQVCQAQYEDMVDDRLGRQRGLEHNLVQMRQDLRWALTAYVTAVIALAQPGEAPINEAIVEHLRPILSLRDSLARTGSEVEAVEQVEGLEPLDGVGAGEPGSQDEAAAE